jgi:hypothetical protein
MASAALRVPSPVPAANGPLMTLARSQRHLRIGRPPRKSPSRPANAVSKDPSHQPLRCESPHRSRPHGVNGAREVAEAVAEAAEAKGAWHRPIRAEGVSGVVRPEATGISHRSSVMKVPFAALTSFPTACCEGPVPASRPSRREGGLHDSESRARQSRAMGRCSTTSCCMPDRFRGP